MKAIVFKVTERNGLTGFQNIINVSFHIFTVDIYFVEFLSIKLEGNTIVKSLGTALRF